MGLHWPELIVILVLALVLFGPKRLPEMGRSLGTSIREFKDGFGGDDAPSDRAHATGPTAVLEPPAGVAVEPGAVPVPVEVRVDEVRPGDRA